MSLNQHVAVSQCLATHIYHVYTQCKKKDLGEIPKTTIDVFHNKERIHRTVFFILSAQWFKQKM